MLRVLKGVKQLNEPVRSGRSQNVTLRQDMLNLMMKVSVALAAAMTVGVAYFVRLIKLLLVDTF